MVKNHLKRIAAPKSWPLKRKESSYLLRPSPGPHTLDSSVSLNFALIDLLKIAKTKKEAVYILHNKEILVDGLRRKDKSFPVGLFDVITVKETKKSYRLIIDNKGKIRVIETKKTSEKPVKITGKNRVREKVQLNLSDGRNYFVDKDEYKVGDSVVIDCKKKKILSHIKLEKGNMIFLLGGKHKGEVGKIEDIIGKKVVYKVGNIIHETLKKYALVIGKDKPVIDLK